MPESKHKFEWMSSLIFGNYSINFGNCSEEFYLRLIAPGSYIHLIWSCFCLQKLIGQKYIEVVPDKEKKCNRIKKDKETKCNRINRIKRCEKCKGANSKSWIAHSAAAIHKFAILLKFVLCFPLKCRHFSNSFLCLKTATEPRKAAILGPK